MECINDDSRMQEIVGDDFRLAQILMKTMIKKYT